MNFIMIAVIVTVRNEFAEILTQRGPMRMKQHMWTITEKEEICDRQKTRNEIGAEGLLVSG